MKKIFILSSFFLASCASTYKDFKSTDVNFNEGVAIGKINVIYNGKNFGENCSVCFETKTTKGLTCHRLTNEGFVFQDLKKGEISFNRVECKDTSIHHYDIKNALFPLGDGVTYFGDINLAWTNQGGFKATDMFGIVGAAISESKNDGVLKMSVATGNMKEVVKTFELQTNQQKIKVVKNLISVGN